jgi:hypothetical protein
VIFECAASDTGTEGLILFDTKQDCVGLFSLAWAQLPEDCDYDREAAADCLDAVEGAGCEDEEPAGYEACYTVYTGSDGCNILASDAR